jgi:tetratricopeptide (TPR) repeat protein
VAAAVGAVVAWRRGGRLEGALLGACLVTLLPVAQLKPLETELSERFLYLPSVASAILMGAVVRRLPRGRMTFVALGVVAGLAAAEASILIPRARMWRDEVDLWEARERESGRSLKASLNLARAYGRRGDRERAVRAYETAEEIEPSLAAGLSAEISALSSDVGSAEYERSLLKSLAELPRDGALWNNLGFHLYRKGDLSGAKDAFAKSIELTPSRGASWLGLAMTRLAGGEVAEADAAAAHALLLEPDLALAAALRAECALRSGRPCDAVAMASAIVLDDPSERAMLERIVSQAQERCRR